MALISPESLERVKQAADIVEVISAHTDLRRQGARWVGLCPFHEERTPSFSVDAAGKALPLLRLRGRRRHDQVRRGEGGAGLRRGGRAARRPLRGRARARAGGPAGRGARASSAAASSELLDRTAAFYAAYLWDSDEAGKAREYLAERGLGEEVLRAFGVGYAPSAWDKVLLRGQRAGFKVDELRGVGLVQRGRGGGEYDRFRSRIMFPIRDRRGRTLGFGGRAMRSDQGAKYVNTAETDFFHKSQHALRDRPGQGGDRQGGAGGRGRGLHRRARPAPGGGRGGGGGDGHGDHRRSRSPRSRGWSRRWSWRSTPTPPGRRRCCGRSGSPPGARCGCGSRRCRPGRTRPR